MRCSELSANSCHIMLQTFAQAVAMMAPTRADSPSLVAGFSWGRHVLIEDEMSLQMTRMTVAGWRPRCSSLLGTTRQASLLTSHTCSLRMAATSAPLR